MSSEHVNMSARARSLVIRLSGLKFSFSFCSMYVEQKCEILLVRNCTEFSGSNYCSLNSTDCVSRCVCLCVDSLQRHIVLLLLVLNDKWKHQMPHTLVTNSF